MGKKANHEEESQVMGVPEHLEALFPNLVVGGGIHQEHDEEHEMTSYATRLSVMNLLGRLFPDFCHAS
jgi:hypothetical protein